ncbi:MAG TPA: cytochrome c family protein [Rhizomicrobium sp.]|nr:cytochrome c family protein [Rhizomicrobium sp.]
MTKTLATLLLAAGLLAPIAAQADGNAAQGKSYFARCAICHSDTKGAPNKIGPNLFGVVGRKAGSMPNFFYSGAMKRSGITWTEEKLEAYINKPQAVVPGNRMAFAGVTSHQQVEDIVAYLETLK